MKNTQTRSASVDWEHLLDRPRVYVDLNGGGHVGNTYITSLDSRATTTDLQKHHITLEEGKSLDFWTDDGDDEGNPDPLLFAGSVHWLEDESQWVAHIGGNGFKHASEVNKETRPLEITTSDVRQIEVSPRRAPKRKPDVVL